MAPNPPACSFIHASMAGSRSTVPLNRNISGFMVALREVVSTANLEHPGPRLFLLHEPIEKSFRLHGWKPVLAPIEIERADRLLRATGSFSILPARPESERQPGRGFSL